MLRVTLFSAAMLSFVLQANAQTNLDKFKPAVKSAAKRMNDALVKKDFKTTVKTTYPKAVEATEGGLTKIEADLARQVESMEKAGTKIKSVYTGNASSIIDTAGEYQCTIPQYMKLQLQNGELQTQTTLIGLSTDKGKTWYFIDVVDKSLNQWRSIFPNLSSKLIVRPAPEPKFTPKVE